MDDQFPKARPERGGHWQLIFWAFFSLLLLGGLAFWLFSGPDKREQLREQAADTINDLASGTPLSGIGDILRQSPPPLPPEIINPSTEKGTLSGRQITGIMASPGDPAIAAQNGEDPQLSLSRPAGEGSFLQGAASRGGASQDKPVFSRELLPPATEDSRVKPDYLSELASWLSSRYRPGPRGGTLELSPQTLNNLCGVNLAGQMPGGRSALLRYAFSPSMLEGLYKIYINKFMEDLHKASDKRGFNPEENQDFLKAVAGKAAAYASALTGILQVPDLSRQLASIDALGQKSVEENAQLAAAVFELDELKEQKASSTQIKTAQLRVEGITARYRRSVEDQETAQRALAAQIRKEAGPALDEESLIFMASWVQRRLGEDELAKQSLQTSAAIMRDLAQRCQNAANPQ